MATNFQSRTDISVAIGSKGSALALGTSHAVGDTWNFLQVTDFNIQHVGATLDVAPNKNGIYGQIESQGHHRPDTMMYEVTLTMRGTATAVLKSCLSLFSEGSSAASLTPASSTGVMKHGADNTAAVTLLFKNGGSDVTKISSVMVGCFCTSMTLREAVDSNGGEMVVESTFVTAYRPVENTLAADAETLDTGTVKNIFSLTTTTINSVGLILSSWEVNITRPLQRIHYIDTTDYNPFGYVQPGPYEVTGTLVAKRDDSIEDLVAKLKGDSLGIPISITSGSDFILTLPDVMIDNSTVENGDFMLQNIPFRAFAETETASIISITIT
tara:strand:+ start:3904 stop:4884 length:981 start_codon:yes stop_codon:yes gene_type:complete